jgi:hypothetical protein
MTRQGNQIQLYTWPAMDTKMKLAPASLEHFLTLQGKITDLLFLGWIVLQ